MTPRVTESCDRASVANLEDLKKGASVRGILPDRLVTVVDIKWHGSAVIELTYKDSSGDHGSELLYRDREPELEIVTVGLPWSFDGDGSLFRVVSEARRIRLAYLFDPLLAVHTSLVDPLPHQITAVYSEMIPRQPLRYLLADDPGAGKTIMAGLLIKELLIRGDLQRCLVICPGMLVEQWQDELDRKFQLPFEILTNDKLESARTGNWFQENPLAICRLDKLSRDEDAQAKLKSHRLGPRGRGRGPQDVGNVLRRRSQVHKALPPGPTRGRAYTPLSPVDSHAAQRQGRGLPAFPRIARWQSVLRVNCF